MEECNYYNNWCEKEKRTCKNCYYENTKDKEEIKTMVEEVEELKDKNKTLKNLQNETNGLYIGMIERKNYFERELQKLGDKIKSKIDEVDIEIQCCEYADDDTEEYKKDIEKEKARLLRDKAILQSLLEGGGIKQC